MKKFLLSLLATFVVVLGASAGDITDVLNQSVTGVVGTSYTAFSDKSVSSEAIYAGQCAGGNSSIQLRSNNSNSGVVTTASGGYAKKIVVEWNESTAANRTLQVYGSSTAYTAATDLYNADTQGTLLGTIVNGESTELEIEDEYAYIGFRSASGAMYLTSVSITWSTGSEAPVVAKPSLTASASFVESYAVEISAADGATIYYTLDGEDPTTESAVYAEPLTITETTTVKAIAVVEGSASGVASATYTALTKSTIAEAQAAETGTTVFIEGTVVASAANGAVIYDGTDYLYYYNTANALTVGQQIRAIGTLATYGGAKQLTSAATITELGTAEVTHPTAVSLDGAAFDAIQQAAVVETRQYVKFVGTLNISGNYYNLTIDGAENAIGSIVKPSEDLSELNGKEVVVEGYLMYVNNKYVYVVATSVKEYTFTPVDCTAKVDVNGWKSDIGNVGNYSKDVAQKEQYNSSTTETIGYVLYQTVEGLENGTYTVELYANASYTSGRGFTSPVADGTTGVAFAFAGDVEQTVPVVYQTAVGTNNIAVLENVLVTDGTLKLGLRKEAAGSNWHTIQIKSLTQTSEKINTEAQGLQLAYWQQKGKMAADAEANANVGGSERKALVEATGGTSAVAITDAIFAMLQARTGYNTLAELIEQGKEAGYDVTEAEALIAAETTTAADAAAKAEEIRPAIALAVNTKAVEGAAADNAILTSFVVNGTFDNGTSPWQTTTNAQNKGTANNQQGAFTGNFFENWNPSAYAGKIYQTINNIPNGTYKLDIAAFVATFNGEKQYVYANEDKTYLTTGTPTAYEVFTIVTNNTLEIGFEQTEAVNGWSGIDNVSLTYFGEGVSLAEAQFGALVAQVKTLRAEAGTLLESEIVPETAKAALTEALEATEQIDVTEEAYNTAIATLTTANAKANAFVIAKPILEAMKAEIDKTNVYTQEAYEAYYGQWATKFDEGTLTYEEARSLQDPSVVTGHRAAVNIDNFLLSAWDTNPDFNEAPYYINTWSVEGDNDGSNFRVPFFEYWTGDDASLGEKTLTATIGGLEPGNYEVSAWVRARAKNGTAALDATGITLTANAGEAVDVTEGQQVGTSQFNLGEYTATGVVAEDGVLKIQFNVAADNNISWLSFKNVKYTKVEEPTIIEIAVSDAITDGTYFCTTFSSDKALDFTGVEGITAYVGKKATNSYGELATLKLTAVEKAPANTGLIIVANEATTYTVPFAEGDVEPVDNDLVVATKDIDLFSAITTEQYGGFVSGPALLGKAQVMDYDADYQIIYKDIIGFTPATKPQAEGTEFVTAGTVYLPLDATTETAYGYFQDGFAVKLQIAAQAVEVANIAELKQSGAEAAILTLNNTKISYISAATAQAVFEDESGAILLQGPAELAAFATYGVTSLSGTIGLEMTNGIYNITDINGIQPAGSDPVEPTVITADNAADYLANYDWKYVKFEGVQYSAANKSITIDALGQEIAVQDILTTGITFPEEDATLNVVGFINDLDLSAYGAGVITSFQPVSIEEASEPEPEIALDGYIYQIKSENLFANGSFDDGVAGWKTIGYTTDAVASNFTLTAEGGFDGGAYITTNGAGVGSANTIRQSVAVEPGKQYYFTVYTSGKAPDSQNFNYNALFQMTDATTENGVLKAFEWPQGAAQTATEWSQTEFVFTAAEGNPFVGVRMGWNSASSFDGFALYEVELIGTDPVPFIAKYEAAVEAARAAIADEANAAATEEIAALQALIPAERPAEVEAMEAAREAIVAATAALIAAPTAIQYNAIMTAYPQDAATLIPEFEAWEGGMVSNKGQHWDGTTTSTYFEQTGAQWGQDAWTNSKTTTLTLPAGSYVIMAAGRSSASENVKAYIKVNDTEIIYPANGDRGLGVDINGVGTKAADATYANNGAGRGWEYRYVEFESDGETPVTLTIGGEATAKNQWMSFTKPLLRTTEENTAIADRILAAAKEAALAELAALPTDCVFGYDKMNIMSAQWDIEDATTPEAVQEILLGVYDTQLLPEEGVAYTIKNVSAGQQLAISTEKVSIEEKASVFFTPVEGGYVLSNEAGEYIFKVGTDKWTLSTTSDIDQAYVLTFNIVEGGYTIQGANGLFGTDNATAGSAVYANKALANNGLWSITEYGEIEIANLQFTAAEAFEEDGTLKIYATYDATAEGIYKENPGKLATEIYVDVYEEGVEEPVQTNIPLAFGAGDITDGQAYAYVSNLDQEKNYTFVLKQFTVGLGDYQFDEETFDVTFVFTDKFFELAEPIYYPALPEIAVYEGTIQQSLVMLQTGMIMGTTTGEQTVTVTPVEEGLVNITFSGFQMPVLPNAIPEFTIENVAVTTDEEGTITYTAEPFTVAVPMGQMTSNNAGTLTGTMTKGAAVPTLVLTLQNATRDIVVFGDDMDAIQAITDQLTGEIATAITGVAPAAQKADGKYLENGKIVIVKGGKTYSTTGVELK